MLLHVPEQQVSPCGQPTSPLVQQRSFARQKSPHSLKPSLQVHLPPLQVAFSGQTVPHPPQFCGSELVFWQTPEQQVWPWPHPGEPLVQHWLLAMQAFPHRLKPSLHTHWPPLHVEFAGQALPQVPQLLLSLEVFLHVPEQQVWPCGQPGAPLLQH